MATCCPGRHGTGAPSCVRSNVAATPGYAATWQPPCSSTETSNARAGTAGSPMLIAAAPLPMSARPGPSRWITPASGPPATRMSTRPDGSGTTQPSGLPRLTTQPSLIGDSASVSRPHIRWRSTYSEPPDGGRPATSPSPRPATSPPRANRSSAPATAVIGVPGSASSTMSVDRRIAGETTVTNSRINHPKARITSADRPATFCTGAKAPRFNKICY